MKSFAPLILSLAAFAPHSQAGNLTPFVPVGKPAVNCQFKKLPANAEVYAVTVYKGRDIPFQIDQSGHSAGQLDVAVHADKPVILLLSAYDPTIWNVGWSKGTKVVAVFATGYHKQAVAGLPKSVQVISAEMLDGRHGRACPGEHVSAEGMMKLANKLTNREVKRIYNQASPTGYIGIEESSRKMEGLITSKDKTPDSFRDATAPLAGQAGLDDAVSKGLIRRVTPEDQAQVKAAFIAKQKLSGAAQNVPPVAGMGVDEYLARRAPMVSLGGYVVLKPFVFPAGLYGGHSASFLVPKGVPRPTGNPGHSPVLYLDNMKCEGPVCNMQ